ncbi:hypothetical protein OQA88_87 [Cercophora sp. LCS_1]
MGEEEVVDERDSAIYVSMTDPVGQPSFKPSPTKPIPRWIRPFEGKQKDEVDEELLELIRQHREAQRRLEAGDANYSSASETSTICPTVPSLPVEEDSIEQQDGPQQPIANRGTSWVSAEPLRIPSSMLLGRVHADANFSSSTFATYHTPPEYPSSVRTSLDVASEVGDIESDIQSIPASESRSPAAFYSVRPPTNIAREQGAQNPLWRLGKTNQQVLKGTPHTYRVSSSIKPLTSSEFVERFQPDRAASTSGSLTPRTSETFSLRRDGAFRGTIVNKLRKNSRPEPNIGQVLEESMAAEGRSRPRSNTAEVTGMGDAGQTHNKRRSVHAELKKLFGR